MPISWGLMAFAALFSRAEVQKHRRQYAAQRVVLAGPMRQEIHALRAEIQGDLHPKRLERGSNSPAWPHISAWFLLRNMLKALAASQATTCGLAELDEKPFLFHAPLEGPFGVFKGERSHTGRCQSTST